MCPQPCLDVPHHDTGVEAGRRGGQSGGGVAVDKQDVRLLAANDVAHAQQHRGRDVEQVLARLHQVQVDVRRDVEGLEDLVEHFAMLRSHADERVEIVGMLAQRVVQRGHLDRFRPRAENEHHLFSCCHRVSSVLSMSSIRDARSLRSYFRAAVGPLAR